MMLAQEPLILPELVRERLKAAILDGRLYAPRRYQANRLASESRFNLDLWSRQTGKSQTNAQDAVHLAAETGESVMCLSASLDLTRELMVKVALYAEVVCGIAGEIQRALLNGELDETLYVDEQGVRITQTVVTLPGAGGARVIGRPANPRTARGFSMHVKLDEFGMHRDQDEIWAAAFPSITSREVLRLDVSSTPGLRTDDKFAALVRDAQNGTSDFVLRRVTIHDAIRDGLKVDPEKLRRNLGDDDRWRREYLCEFVDEAGAFLTYDLIRACEHEGISLELPPDTADWDAKGLTWDPAAGDLYLGVDIGRKHDLTVLWLLQMVGDVAWTRAVVRLRNVPFALQQEIGSRILRHLPVRRACVDATGIGAMLAEAWQDNHGDRVEALTYTAPLKAALANPLRARLQDRLLRLPIDATIRESLHSVRKVVTAAGNIRYLGERTADGHADDFWALANAVHALDVTNDAGVILL
jgi:phage FluMu gp28-like protein